MNFFNKTTRAQNIISKNSYMEGTILKVWNRKGSKFIKGLIINQNFISGQILVNKNMIKFLGCYRWRALCQTVSSRHHVLWPPLTQTMLCRKLCVMYNTNGNVHLGFTVWDVYMNGNVCLRFTVWDVHTNGNDWASIIVCDGSPDRTWALFAPRVWPKALSRTVSGSCGKDPPIAHTGKATV